jgi:hypothetical protein
LEPFSAAITINLRKVEMFKEKLPVTPAIRVLRQF